MEYDNAILVGFSQTDLPKNEQFCGPFGSVRLTRSQKTFNAFVYNNFELSYLLKETKSAVQGWLLFESLEFPTVFVEVQENDAEAGRTANTNAVNKKKAYACI